MPFGLWPVVGGPPPRGAADPRPQRGQVLRRRPRVLSQRVGGRDAAARVCLGPYPARLRFWRFLDQAAWARGPERRTPAAPPTHLCPLFHTCRAEGLCMRAPARVWCRPPWPSAGSTAPVRTACSPATPTAPGAGRPRPAWPCPRTRRTAPAGTEGGGPAPRTPVRGRGRVPDPGPVILQDSDSEDERRRVRLPG